MWDLMLAGLYTAPQILGIANREWGFRTRPMRKLGGKPLSRAGIYRILTDPFYYGWFEYPRGSGRWYQGNHKPMITREEFERVQVLLGRTGTPRPSKARVFAFTGLIRCGECGGSVTAEEKHQMVCAACRFKFAYRAKDSCPRCATRIEKMLNPTFRHYTYYHCARTKNPHCTQRSVEAMELEHQIARYLARIRVSEQFKSWAIQYLHELHGNEVAARNEIRRSQGKAYADCLKRLDNLIRLRTAPQNVDGSFLSDTEYGRQRFELLQERARLEELSRDIGHRVEQWLELAEKTFDFACTAHQRFSSGDTQVKKEIMAAVGSNLVLKDKKLRIEAKKPFLILEKSHSHGTPPEETFEPGNDSLKQGCTALCIAARLTLRGRRDDVRTFGPEMEALVREVYDFFKRSALESVSSSFRSN